LGTIVGALAGAPGGPAAIATSIIGGTLGYFGGNAAAQLLASHIADWILGDVNDIDQLPQPLVDQVIDPAIQNAAPAQPAPPTLSPAPGNQTAAPPNQSSARTSRSQTPTLSSVRSLNTSAPVSATQLAADLGVLQQAANAFPAGDPRRIEYENEIQNKATQLNELFTVTTATASAIPPVDRNEVSELSKQLSTSSQVVIAQPVTNVVNNINNDNSSTSVASSGSGTNIPSGRTYNIDSSLTRVNRGRVYA
jgi:hypothetical protein